MQQAPTYQHSFNDLISQIPRKVEVSVDGPRNMVVLTLYQDDGEAVLFDFPSQRNNLLVLKDDHTQVVPLFQFASSLGLSDTVARKIKDQVVELYHWMEAFPHPDYKTIGAGEYRQIVVNKIKEINEQLQSLSINNGVDSSGTSADTGTSVLLLEELKRLQDQLEVLDSNFSVGSKVETTGYDF